MKFRGIVALIFVVLLFKVGAAQDQIVLRSGRAILGYDTEIAEYYVKFRKKPNCDDCPKKLIMRKRVQRVIMGKDGMTQEFSSSRNYRHGGSISFNYGLSAPIGKFASKDIEDEDAGLAKGGQLRECRFSYFWGGGIGLCATYKNHRNRVWEFYLEDLFEDRYLTDLEVELHSPWMLNSVLVGAAFSGIGKGRVNFDIDCLLGYSFVESPTYTISTIQNGVTYEGKVDSYSGGALAFSVKGQLLCHLSKRFSLNFGCGYFGTKPMIDYPGKDYAQPIEIFELNGGIGIHF